MTGSASKLRILVLGHIIRGPLGGLAWHYLQYVMGLAKLGHDVCFVEESGDSEWCCYDPSTGNIGTDPTYGIRFASELFEKVGLAERWAYYDVHGAGWMGPAATRIGDIIASADLLLNISGANVLRASLQEVPMRVYIDTDPVFTQIQHLSSPAQLANSMRHNRFLTFAGNIDRETTPIPRDGLPWQPTRQPIVMDAWPVVPASSDGLFTTVMSWDSYKVEEHQGVRYGMKSESFGPYLSLPGKAGHIFELSLGSPHAPRDLLMQAGWKLRNPLEFDPWSYRRYIQQSKAEFTVAKHGYVVSRCGWFSERSAVYMASGRPVITEETGFSDWMETGRGVSSFRSLDEAIVSVREVLGNYDLHSRAAREMAEAYFDSGNILADLLDRVFDQSNQAPYSGATS